MSLIWLNEMNRIKDWFCSTESEIIFESHNKWLRKLFDYTSGSTRILRVGVEQVEGPQVIFGRGGSQDEQN